MRNVDLLFAGQFVIEAIQGAPEHILNIHHVLVLETNQRCIESVSGQATHATLPGEVVAGFCNLIQVADVNNSLPHQSHWCGVFVVTIQLHLARIFYVLGILFAPRIELGQFPIVEHVVVGAATGA